MISSRSHRDFSSSNDLFIMETGLPISDWWDTVIGGANWLVLDCIAWDWNDGNFWAVFTVEAEGTCNSMTGAGDAVFELFGILFDFCWELLTRNRKYCLHVLNV